MEGSKVLTMNRSDNRNDNNIGNTIFYLYKANKTGYCLVRKISKAWDHKHSSWIPWALFEFKTHNCICHQSTDIL